MPTDQISTHAGQVEYGLTVDLETVTEFPSEGVGPAESPQWNTVGDVNCL